MSEICCWLLCLLYCIVPCLGEVRVPVRPLPPTQPFWGWACLPSSLKASSITSRQRPHPVRVAALGSLATKTRRPS
ncbi:hypothetical protein F4818DRAFT_406024 [Hypoxylon cercidicola]|nr:hypothetical protein F4818DRAFT_406024 [Hypoxylon cercidicola]